MSKNLLKTFLIYGLTSGLSRFISLLLIPLYVRVFSVSENGIIDMIQTINQVLLIFGILQLETSVQRYYYELNKEEKKRMIATVLVFVFVVSVFISVLLNLFSVFLSNIFFDTANYSLDISIAAWIIPILNVSILNFIVLRYQKKSLIFSVMTLLQVLLTTSFILFFVFKIRLGIKSVFLGQLIGYVVVVAIQFFYIRKEVSWCFDIGMLKKMLHYSIPQFPARIGSESVSRVNRFLLLTFLSTSSLGLYAVAVKFASAMELVNVAFTMAWVPYVYESLKDNGYQNNFRAVYVYVMHITFFIVILLSLFATEIVTTFTTPDYYEIKFILPGLFLFYGLYIIKGMVEIGISISKKMIYLTYIYLSVAVLNILFLFVGIKLFELKGVAYALIFTNFCLILFHWYVTEKLHPIGFDIRKFIVLFFFAFMVILFLMNSEVTFISRVVLVVFLFCMLLVYLYRKKDIWKKLPF